MLRTADKCLNVTLKYTNRRIKKGILGIFKKLTEWVSIILKLVQLNSDQRQEIRDAVSGIADELTRDLDLVIQRIEGVRSELPYQENEEQRKS